MVESTFYTADNAIESKIRCMHRHFDRRSIGETTIYFSPVDIAIKNKYSVVLFTLFIAHILAKQYRVYHVANFCVGLLWNLRIRIGMLWWAWHGIDNQRLRRTGKIFQVKSVIASAGISLR